MRLIKSLIIIMTFIVFLCNSLSAKEIQTFNHEWLLSDYEKASDETYQKYVNEGLPYRIMYKNYDTGEVTYEYFNCDESEYAISENNNEHEATAKKKTTNKNKSSSKKYDVSEISVNETIDYAKEREDQNDEEKNIGWIEFNGFWYYQDERGNNKKGWQYIGDKWYYLDPETYVMVIGLKEINNNKYFFNSDGTMLKNSWATIDGNNYYFDIDGTMLTNVTRRGADGKKYYFDGNGVATTVNEFFNYAYNADHLNSLRGNCKNYYENYNRYGSIYYFSLKGALETYEDVLNQCYRLDIASGNQKGIEEEQKALTEMREWKYGMR